MSNNPRIILLPFAPQIFPKKYFKKGFALNKWPQVPVLKWILIGPFLLLIILLVIPFFFIMIISHFLKLENDAKNMDRFKKIMESMADMGFGESNSRDIENKYKRKDVTKSVLKIVCLLNNKTSLFEKIKENDFFEIADEVWVYRDKKEIYKKLAKISFDRTGSIFVHENSSTTTCSFTFLNEQNQELNDAVKKQKEISYTFFQKQKPRTPKIQLLPNELLTPQIVYYYEPDFDISANNALRKNLKKIDKKLSEKGYTLMYLPRMLDTHKLNINEATEFSLYNIPQFNNNKLNDVLKSIQSENLIDQEVFKKAIDITVGMPLIETPCFIRCVEDNFMPEFKKYTYSIFPLVNEEGESIQQKIDFYLDIVGVRNEPQYRMVVPDENDPDEMFYSLGHKLNPEIKANIDAIKKLNDDKLLFSSMVYLISSLKESQPELCKQLNSTLYQAIQNQHKSISSIVIDEQHRIFLPDYNNIEIEMGPLPKTVFLFLLKHPEGVIFKELRQHVNELVAIYAKVGNRLDMDQIRDSINELTDPRSNSINEKCSRIKEAFVSKIDNSIAEHYYVTGGRSSSKGIKLDRSLVQFSQTK